MNESHMKNSHSFSAANSTRIPLLSLLGMLTVGCASGPAATHRAIAKDYPDAWANRVRSLPVEVHGSIPGHTLTQTAAAIDHGVVQQDTADFEHTGVSLYAMPRVIVYIGGNAAPSRDRYCELQPDFSRRAVMATKGLLIRGALCDGPRPVAYARITLAEPSATTVGPAVARLESDLVQGLSPPPPQPPEFGN
jgi:hypothetical protein